MKKERKIDQFISAIVLLLYAVVIIIRWVMAYQAVPPAALTAVSIIATIIQCLVYLVLLYNALGWTSNWIIKVLFIVIAVFLIASAIAMQVPVVQNFFIDNNIPIIL